MTAIIGLDLGTTNCKAVVLDADGRVQASASSSYSLRVPQPGWAEQDPADVWHAATETLHKIAASYTGRLDGLCLSGAMHSLFPVAEDGTPLAPAMTWADNRAVPQARQLLSRGESLSIYQRTGCPLRSTYYPARLQWWMQQEPGVAQRAARFVALKDWVLYRLCGVWATDLGLASTTGLLDIHRLTWDAAAFRLAGISPDRLPPLVSPSAVVGGVTAQAAAETGLPAGLHVVAGSSDGGLANLGTGVVAPGQTVITVGTSGAVRRMVDRPLLDPAERTWCYVLTEGRWFAGGAINNGGLAVQWVRDRLYPDLSGQAAYDQLFEDAASIVPGADGILLLPYFAGERSPYWAPEARAVMYGLRLEHTRAHLARAALEGIAFCLADVWNALSTADAYPESVRLTGGITRSPVWAQILADVLGVPLQATDVADASATGAALLGLQALDHPPLEKLAANIRPGRVFSPDTERHAFYVALERAFDPLHKSLVTSFDSVMGPVESLEDSLLGHPTHKPFEAQPGSASSASTSARAG